MKRYRNIGVATLACLLLLHPILTASSKTTVTGGGEGTFDADVDGDGDIDGSYFGVAVTLHHVDDRGRSPKTEGHFVCAMWGNTDFLGLPLMAVEGPVTSATSDLKKRIVTLRGVGTVDLGTGASGFFTDVPFEVQVTEGGPSVGTIKLTVIGVFDGTPGDTRLGNNNYDLPVETVFRGHIRIQ